MRQALRRLLWILPTLAALSLFGFWGVTSALPSARDQPRFINPKPVNVRDLAEKAMAAAAEPGPEAEQAGEELVRLGGAALPYILPRLDTLEPRARARVAVALAPLARRMAVGDADELDDPEAAVIFWTRFWQDRALDFRELVARRAVTRLADKSSALRRSDLTALDTFALPEIMRQLPLPERAEQVPRARRLVAALAGITELGATIAPGATVEEAARVVIGYRDWWRVNRASFTPREGGERVIAMFRDTQYGEWLAYTVVYRADELFSELGRASIPSLRLLAWALLAGALLGLGILAAPVPRGNIYHFITLAVAASPLLLALTWTSSGAAAWLMALFGGVRAAVLARATARADVHSGIDHAERGFGLSPLTRRLRRVKVGAGYLVSDLPTAVPGILSACLVVEVVTGSGALGARTLAAIQARDVGWVMLLLVALSTSVAVLQVVSDLLLGWLDPRLREALVRRDGAIT